MRKNYNNFNNYSNESGKNNWNNNPKKNQDYYKSYNKSYDYNKNSNSNDSNCYSEPVKFNNYIDKNECFYEEVPYNYDENRYNNYTYNKNHFNSYEPFYNNKLLNDFNYIGSEYGETYMNSKPSKYSNNSNRFVIKKNFLSESFLNLLEQSNEESKIIEEDSLFEEIKDKLNNNKYAQRQEELIKDVNLLISKRAFIKAFSDYSFLNTESFMIFKELKAKKIHLNLNLINFINIINALYKYTNEDPNQLAIILDKIGINFSWINVGRNLVAIVLLTPKSSLLYNYISTHGKFGIENKEYQQKVKEFLKHNEKNIFDYGYSYEDVSIAHLKELMGENNFKLFPNVMYYVKKNLAKTLIKLKLVEIPYYYKIVEKPFNNRHGYNETDLIISMLEKVEIESNFNFRPIIKGNLAIDKNKITLEKNINYLFEIKTSVYRIVDKIVEIRNSQSKFIEALKNVKINGEKPYANKIYKSVLMCDNNSLIADEVAHAENSIIKNKPLIYSGFQVGITFINRLNNNLKDLYKEIDGLKEENSLLKGKLDLKEKKIDSLDGQIVELKGEINKLKGENNKLKEENTKLNGTINELKEENTKLKGTIKELKEQVKDLNGQVNKFNLMFQALAIQYPYLNEIMASNSINNNELSEKGDQKTADEINNKTNNACSQLEEFILKLLDNVFKDNLIFINAILKSDNKLELVETTFETVFKCFESILSEMVKIYDNLLYKKIEIFIKVIKYSSEASQLEKLILEKIQKGDVCSIYYEGLRNLLFGIDGKTNCELFNVLNTFDESKIRYLKKLIGFIEIFENNQNIKGIEVKLQGALLFIISKLLDKEMFIAISNKVNKNNEDIRFIIKILISSINPNYVYTSK